MGGIRALRRINETIVLILPGMRAHSSPSSGQQMGNRGEVSLPEQCPFVQKRLFWGVRLAYQFFFSLLQISLWSVLGRHSATWSCTSSLSLGSSEPLEVLPLSLASAATLITSALWICQNFDMQVSEVVSHKLTSFKWLLRVVLVPDSLMQYSLTQNSGWNQLAMRHFQHHPFFLSAG